MPIFSQVLALLTVLVLPLFGWAQANDGFQRRDGTMYLVRNGLEKPMPHDVHLPNGRLVTRDGFVVQRDGRRTELRDGQACTLLGEPTAVTRTAAGKLQLAGPAAGTGRPTPKSRGNWRGKRKGPGRHKGHRH